MTPVAQFMRAELSRRATAHSPEQLLKLNMAGSTQVASASRFAVTSKRADAPGRRSIESSHHGQSVDAPDVTYPALPNCLLPQRSQFASTVEEDGPLPQSVARAGQQKSPAEDSEASKTALERKKRWLRELDLNQRPSGYEPDELPDCSIPRHRCVTSYRDAKRAALAGQPSDL